MTEITAFRNKTGDNPVFYVAEVNLHTAHRNPSSRPSRMSINDPITPETQPSMQPKRTFPWDYTTSGKRPATSVPEIKNYAPRKHDDVFSNGHSPNRPTNRVRPREVRFVLDNPAFDKLSSPNNQENPQYDPYQEYTRRFPIPENDVEPAGLQRRYPPSSPEEQKDPEKKKKNCKYCVLIIIVIILLLLLITMTGLFIWRMVCCKKKDDNLLTTTTPVSATSPSGCKVNPNPIVFTTLPQGILKKLDTFSTFLEKEVNNNQAAAVSVNVVYGDKVIWEKGLGVLNKTEKPLRSPNSKTMYPCASVSKVLTAVVLFKLANDKRVRLDDEVVNYEADFSVKNPFNNLQITLRELAAQRSGLKREAPCYPIPEGSTNLCPYDYNTMLKRIKNLTLLRSPGSKPQYSNLGYGLLGRVLFNSFSSAGVDFDRWMKKEIFSQLNMMSTTFSPSNSQKLKMPVGYLDSTYINHIYEWGWLQPTGGMFSTVEDLSKLLIELMTNKPDNNRYLSTSMTEELFKPDYIFPDSKTMTGTPWEMRQHDGYIIRQKAGYIYGYDSYVAMIPEIRLGMSMFCTDCQQKLGSSIPNYFTEILSVFKEEFVRASTKNFTLPADPKPFVGQYNSTIPTLRRIDIKEKSNYLTFDINGFDIFLLNSTGLLTFKVSVNPVLDCMAVFSLGVENEVVFFDKPSPRDGKSPGFYMYGASVDGRTYFTRVN